MFSLKTQLLAFWQKRPAFLRYDYQDLDSRFPSGGMFQPLELLYTLYTLTYLTEMVGIGRNLSDEEGISAQAQEHLAEMSDVLSN